LLFVFAFGVPARAVEASLPNCRLFATVQNHPKDFDIEGLELITAGYESAGLSTADAPRTYGGRND